MAKGFIIIIIKMTIAWQCGNDKWEAQVYDFPKVHGEGKWVYNNHKTHVKNSLQDFLLIV
jgi:hypothetical protein